MKSFNLDGLTMKELDQLINDAQIQKENLIKQEKRKDWEDLNRILCRYIDKWGSIDIEERAYDITLTLDTTSDLSISGLIII
jgi:hypothetical protein